MSMLVKAYNSARHMGRYTVVRAVIGSSTLVTMILASGAGGHWH